MEIIEVKSKSNFSEINSSTTKKEKLKKKKNNDEIGLYHILANISFATGVFLLGLSNFYNYNSKMLSIFGFFLPGWGQIIAAVMDYKYKHYNDGNVFFFYGLNWFINSCYDFFPDWGWMEPLNNNEYAIYNLMCSLFVLVFFVQSLFDIFNLNKMINFFALGGFIFSSIGYFDSNNGYKKCGGIFNFFTSFIAYYSGFGNAINRKRNKITFPLFDGKSIGQKIN